MKKSCLNFFTFIFLTSILSSCSVNEKKELNFKANSSSKDEYVEQVFRMNLHSEPASLDPRLVRDIPTITTSKMLFDGLMRTNENNEPLCSLAKCFHISEDKKIYEFELRETFWSNGLPVTAYDFEASWKKILSPDFPAEFAHQLFVIKNALLAKTGKLPLDQVGISCKDAKTLVIELETPYPFFLQLVSSPLCYPICSSLEKQSPEWATYQGKDFVCNGPFRLIKWNHGNELIAEKNPLYWEAEVVRLQKIVLTMIEDEHTELNMYENGELDWAGSPNSSIPPEALPSLKESLSQDDELVIIPIAGTYCYKFNTKMPPFDSVKMRKAFSYAINRRLLIDNILQANQMVATALLPPCMSKDINDKIVKDKIVYFNDGDHSKAQELFEEALAEMNLTRETLPSITLIFSKSEKHQKIAQAVQQEWSNAFDIKINLQSYEWNTYINHLSKHNYQVGGRGWVSDLSDPKSLLEIYKFSNDESGSGNNDTQWENEDFISLIDSATSCSDLEERHHLLLKAEKILMEEMPITPLFHSTACYLKKSYVKDVYMSELCDLDFKRAYIAR